MSDCPCGSGAGFDACCEPYIKGNNSPETAEQLMRARYTAHTTADIKYIVKTHHPKTRDEISEETTRDWAEKSTWLGIDILSTTGGGKDDTEGEIEFKATYREPNGQRQVHHELSEFEKHEGTWFFKDAKPPKVEQFQRDQPKVGRNDPCPCGSGKKFKKCCQK